MEIFEAGMLLCFGASWPVAVYKTYKVKSVKGKSFAFDCLITAGYICGLIHKYLYNNNWVIWLYMMNLIFILMDMFLFCLYRKNFDPPTPLT